MRAAVEKYMSPRLLMAAHLVPQCGCVCDIGTDHGYLAVWLAQSGTAQRVIAADIKEGPLAQARKTVRSFGLEGKIELRLSNGFANIPHGECGCAVIAGMGGETIAEILAHDIGIGSFVLQPQSAHAELRAFLCDNGYAIEREELCREGRKMYAAMLVRRGKSEPFTRTELELGKLTVKEKHPLLKQYAQYRLHEIDCALSGLQNAKNADARRAEYEYLKNEYEKIINEKRRDL